MALKTRGAQVLIIPFIFMIVVHVRSIVLVTINALEDGKISRHDMAGGAGVPHIAMGAAINGKERVMVPG